jgi:hypothetical protein
MSKETIEIHFRNSDKIALIDAADYELVKNYTWSLNRSYSSYKEKFYATASIPGQRATVIMHRLIMDCPKGMVVDHINHNGLDNRRVNLRIFSYSDNAKAKYCRAFDIRDARFNSKEGAK